MYKQSEYQQVHAHDDLRRLVLADISTPWPFRYPLVVKISISLASFPGQLSIFSKIWKLRSLPQTIREWNDLTESLTSSELSDDSVS